MNAHIYSIDEMYSFDFDRFATDLKTEIFMESGKKSWVIVKRSMLKHWTHNPITSRNSF